MSPPPRNDVLPIVVHTRSLYLHIYNTGNGLSKRNKLGIHIEIEKLSLECLCLAVDATLRTKQEKIPLVQTIRRNTEVLKHLIRTEKEIGIITEKTYIYQIKLLENISMQATGWYKSIQNRQQ